MKLKRVVTDLVMMWCDVMARCGCDSRARRYNKPMTAPAKKRENQSWDKQGVEIPEKLHNRMIREEWFNRILTRDSLEGGDVTEGVEGEYTVHFGWETLERLYDLGEIRDVKVTVLIREAVAFWLELQEDKSKL